MRKVLDVRLQCIYINTVRSLNKRYNVITSTMLGNILLLTFKFSCIIS